MKEEKLARIFYSDLWGLREEKYDCLLKNDVKTTDWKALDINRFEENFRKTRWARKYATGFYFFTPKSARDLIDYGDFWGVSEIFEKWASRVKTRRDNFMVAFSKEELVQRLRLFIGNLPDEMIRRSLKIQDTKYWSIRDAREEVRKVDFKGKIMPYAYRPFDSRFVFYFPSIIERGDARKPLTKHFLRGDNLGLGIKRSRYIKVLEFKHVFVTSMISDINLFGDQTLYFPLYLYRDKSEQQLLGREASKAERICNFTSEFLQAIKESLDSEPTPEEIFCYIYAVLYSPTYRKRYEEFLKIDFPRVPLPSDYEVFKELSDPGRELVNLHLLRHPALSEPGIGVSKFGSNAVEKVTYDEDNRRVFINKERYFEGISKEVWEYRIGAYQVMEKYLKDRRKRKLSLDEINHYMRVAKAIQLTMELQEEIDIVYGKMEEQEALLRVKDE